MISSTPDTTGREGHVASVVFPEPLIIRKLQINPRWGTFCKVPDQCSSKVKVMKVKERPGNRHRWEETKETGLVSAVQCPGLVPGTEKRLEKKTERI